MKKNLYKKWLKRLILSYCGWPILGILVWISLSDFFHDYVYYNDLEYIQYLLMFFADILAILNIIMMVASFIKLPKYEKYSEYYTALEYCDYIIQTCAENNINYDDIKNCTKSVSFLDGHIYYDGETLLAIPHNLDELEKIKNMNKDDLNKYYSSFDSELKKYKKNIKEEPKILVGKPRDLISNIYLYEDTSGNTKPMSSVDFAFISEFIGTAYAVASYMENIERIAREEKNKIYLIAVKFNNEMNGR